MTGGIQLDPDAGRGGFPASAGRGRALGGWYGRGAPGVSKSELALLEQDRDRERDTVRAEDLERDLDCLVPEDLALSLLPFFLLLCLTVLSPAPEAIDTVSSSDRLSQSEDEDESF